MNNINLNDILRLEDLENVKIKFNLMFGDNWNPIALFKNGEIDEMLDGYYWNYKKKKSYKKRQVTVGFVRIKPNENLWLPWPLQKAEAEFATNKMLSPFNLSLPDTSPLLHFASRLDVVIWRPEKIAT